MTDPTYLTNNLHLIRMAVDFWLTEERIGIQDRDVGQMKLFQRELEQHVPE